MMAFPADFYLDFGYAGIILVPLLLGIFCGWSYNRVYRLCSITDALPYSMLATCIIMTPYFNWFSMSRSWTLFIMALLLGTLCREHAIKGRSPDQGSVEQANRYPALT